MARLLVVAVAAFSLWGCAAAQDSDAGVDLAAPVPAPPDVGQVSRFLDCSANPRRELSPREQCEMEALRSRCTPHDDCYVSCIASPHGTLVGGGCAHVCGPPALQGDPQPAALEECKNLPGRSAVGIEPGPNKSFKPNPLRGSA